MVFRSPEAKLDPVRSWHRPDRPFFAAGACHILAAAFLDSYPESGYRAILIRATNGYRGSYVMVSDGETTFDYHGFSSEHTYLDHYLKKVRRFFPNWRCTILRLTLSPSSDEFCEKYRHRKPTQFFVDPQQRALAYVKRFRAPTRENLILKAT